MRKKENKGEKGRGKGERNLCSSCSEECQDWMNVSRKVFLSLHAYFTITRCDQESSVRIFSSFLVLGRNVILKKKRKRGKERNQREEKKEME